MVTIYDVPTNELIELVAKELKASGAAKAPAWAIFVKTGAHKERPPTRSDWWEIRAAAILRKVCVRGPIGVSKLRTQYGGKKNCGMQPEEFRKGSGAIIRHVLQQLDKAGLTRHTKVGVHSGRVITPKGKSVLDKAATQLAKDLKITIKPAHEEPVVAKEPAAPAPAPAEAGAENADKKPAKKKAPGKDEHGTN